ncbi:MAG: sigma-70 family RNA polymerase sigma factor [Candidatus Korobacteraceae bacterium]
MGSTVEVPGRQQSLSDEEVVAQVLAGNADMFEVLMRRYNQRLYRVARAILRNDDEAEDVMQDAYVRAYEHLDQFAGRAKFSTWLTRIAVHEALARQHRGKRYARVGGEARQAFSFHAVRCDRVVKMVFERIHKRAAGTQGSKANTQ